MNKFVFLIIYMASAVGIGIATYTGGLTIDTWQFWVIVLCCNLAVLSFPSQSLYGVMDGSCCRHEYHLVPGSKISLDPTVDLHFACRKCGRYLRIEAKPKKED